MLSREGAPPQTALPALPLRKDLTKRVFENLTGRYPTCQRPTGRMA
jgi:hypothetical protein